MREYPMGRGEMMRGAVGESYGEHLEENIEKGMNEITVLVGGIDLWNAAQDIAKIQERARELKLPPDAVQRAVADGFPELCANSEQRDEGLRTATEIVATFGLGHGQKLDPNIRENVMRGLSKYLQHCHLSTDDSDDYWQTGDRLRAYSSLADRLRVSEREQNKIVHDAVIEKIKSGWGKSAQDTLKRFKLSTDILDTPEAIDAAKEGLKRSLELGNSWNVRDILKLFPSEQGSFRSDPELREAARKGIEKEFVERHELQRVHEIHKDFDVQVDQKSFGAIYFDKAIPRAIREARETYPNPGWGEKREPNFSAQHQKARLTHALSPEEYKRLSERYPDIFSTKNPREAAFDALHQELVNAGGENGNIANSMESFAKIFGTELVMKFANRPDLSRHNAFIVGAKIEAFASAQGYNIQDEKELARFRKSFSLILEQVAQDDAKYDVGTANDKFNEVMTSINVNAVEKMLNEVESLDIPALTKRVKNLRTGRFQPLGSWKGLKEAAELIRLLEKKEMVEAIKTSDAPGAVKDYVSALMEHPNISLDALQNFLSRPSEFLNADGAYVDGNLQHALSPARMLDVERLGLGAADVRDALADGTMDKLQILPPDEQQYLFDADGNDIQTLAYLQRGFSRALGRQREGIKGEAQDPKMLFTDLTRWAKSRGVSKDDCIAWLRGEKQLDLGDSDRSALAGLLHAPGRGIPQPEGHKIRVRIGQKSDPSMIVAGNDTASCMPFGDGKTNVYTWNPNCSQLVVERQTSEGEWRTMAQSVLMLDIDAKKPAAEVISSMKNGGRVSELLSAEIFASLPKIVCDNIEPAPNDIAAGRALIIEKAYANFFRSYVAKHAEALGIDASEVIIGKESYQTNRPDWSFPQTDNTFLPLAPVSYTDNAGPKAYKLATGIESKKVGRADVSTVTAADVLPMALLEGKGFSDNPNLVFGLYDRQHKIVGASVAREKNGDPDLCLMSRDTHGVPVGYIIAYMDRTTNVPEVFIDDMAVDRSRNVLAARHAVRILKEFLTRYAKHYIDTDAAFPPIYAQMRESTSYKLLTSQAETLSKEFNLQIEIADEGETTLGGETFKLVRIFVGKTADQLITTKTAFHDRQRLERPSDARQEDQDDRW